MPKLLWLTRFSRDKISFKVFAQCTNIHISSHRLPNYDVRSVSQDVLQVLLMVVVLCHHVHHCLIFHHCAMFYVTGYLYEVMLCHHVHHSHFPDFPYLGGEWWWHITFPRKMKTGRKTTNLKFCTVNIVALGKTSMKQEQKKPVLNGHCLSFWGGRGGRPKLQHV